MTTDADIVDDFMVQVAAFAAEFSPALPVAYPNVHFTPPDDGSAWLEVSWFPNETLTYGLPDEGPFLHRGFFQISVCGRTGGGLIDGSTLAGAVIAAFAKGTEIDIARVERKPWISSVMQSDESIMYPVTVPYRGMVLTTIPVPALLLEDGDTLLLESGDELLLEA